MRSPFRLTWSFAGFIFLGLLLGLATGPVPVEAQETPPNECATCHAALPDAAHAAPAAAFREDVHQQRGFGCVDCHGGDPTATDKDRAKSPASGYTGVPRGPAQIAVCSRCHSDAGFMRRFAPRQRVDQEQEYASSIHGKRLAEGDSKVATCASCHGAHGIRVVSDAKSPVFPTSVAATCAACHADAAHMAGYALPDGSPLPVTQRDDYQKSVHFEALTARNDLSAPTCNDCHGNHGAAPPGVGAVANVCGTCHAIFATKFESSVHQQVFDKGCVECHGNHAVVAPPPEMLGATEPAVCVVCHGGDDDPGFVAAGRMRQEFDRFRGELASTTELIERARVAGMEVSDQELALGEARNHLVLARTEMHAFAPDSVSPIVDQGLEQLRTIAAAGDEALAELSYRRRGLAISLLAILLFVVALGLKIRQIERRPPG
jgi:predicted CXXCH cytochrome family protein